MDLRMTASRLMYEEGDMEIYKPDEWTTLLAPSERESYIHNDHSTGTITLYTSYWRMANRLIKLGVEPDEVSKDTKGKICGVTFKADVNDRDKVGKLVRVRVFAPKIRRGEEVTEEDDEEPVGPT